MSDSPPSGWVRILRAVGLLVAIASGLYAILIPRASSPDYKQLFWVACLCLAFHLVTAVVYALFVPNRSRWVVLSVSALAVLSFGELTLRVWL